MIILLNRTKLLRRNKMHSAQQKSKVGYSFSGNGSLTCKAIIEISSDFVSSCRYKVIVSVGHHHEDQARNARPTCSYMSRAGLVVSTLDF